jgi:protein SCO1
VKQVRADRKRHLVNLILVVIVALCLAPSVQGQMGGPKGGSPMYNSRPYTPSSPTGLPPALENVGIDQKLDSQLPLDLLFTDENGAQVRLGDYFGKKPVIVSLVYYDCPMLCNQVLNGMISAFRVMAFQPGEEFDVVTVSFDAREKAAQAAAKKKTYIDYLPAASRAKAATGWHFLTGDETNIKRLTEAIGFRYRYDSVTNQFAHASAIYVTTPQGKLARYFYGIEYAPKELRLGLVEASENKIGTAMDQLMLYCYHYDPATGKYGAAVINLIRLGGVLTLIGIAALFFVMRRRTARRWDIRVGGTT